MAKARITVVQRAIYRDLADRYINKTRYPKGFDACPLWKDGQTFEVEGSPTKPADFPCDWAWTDIHRDVAMILFGANPPWMARAGVAVSCCRDGLRPVSFLIERAEE